MTMQGGLCSSPIAVGSPSQWREMGCLSSRARIFRIARDGKNGALTRKIHKEISSTFLLEGYCVGGCHLKASFYEAILVWYWVNF